MAKTTRQLKKRVKYLEGQLHQKNRSPTGIWSYRFKLATSFLVTLVGLGVGLLVFLPRLTVEADSVYDKNNPTPISFKIRNTGLITLNEVQPAIGICQLSYGQPIRNDFRCDGPINPNSKLAPIQIRTQSLSYDEPHSFWLDDVITAIKPAQFAGADISIIVEYKPAWLGWACGLIPCSKEFRFVTRERDSKLYWQSLNSAGYHLWK